MKIYTCLRCKKSFNNKAHLRKHLLRKIPCNVTNLDYEIDISKICKNNNLFKIDLIANNPKSLFDLKIGLNRKKRSIVLKEIEITK